ncbi:biotin/lipoyl-binding protein [bacterium]|nr:biotin/lipoyl-binding protein [bacterium]
MKADYYWQGFRRVLLMSWVTLLVLPKSCRIWKPCRTGFAQTIIRRRSVRILLKQPQLTLSEQIMAEEINKLQLGRGRIFAVTKVKQDVIEARTCLIRPILTMNKPTFSCRSKQAKSMKSITSMSCHQAYAGLTMIKRFFTWKMQMTSICLLLLSTTIQAASLESSVKVIELVPQKLEVTKEYVGHLDPLERVTIRSEASGTVEQINFVKGQRIQKGEVLVHISTERLGLNVAKSRSNYQLAKINYETQKALAAKSISLRKVQLSLAQSETYLWLAKTEYLKEKELWDKKYSTESNLDLKRNTLETRKIVIV